jgi:hypothetical protein
MPGSFSWQRGSAAFAAAICAGVGERWPEVEVVVVVWGVGALPPVRVEGVVAGAA